MTNPPNDGAFRGAAEHALNNGGGRSPEGLRSNLVTDYPDVAVVRGIQDRGTERWYAYRDGHWFDQPAD